MSNVINFPARPARKAPTGDALVQRICAALVAVFVAVGIGGLVHPAPWSPMGKAQHAAEAKR